MKMPILTLTLVVVQILIKQHTINVAMGHIEIKISIKNNFSILFPNNKTLTMFQIRISFRHFYTTFIY